MSVKPIAAKIDNNAPSVNKLEVRNYSNVGSVKNLSKVNNDKVSFTGGSKFIVSFMDYIAAGGFAASFIIQDGLGFIAPRVGKGLLRGGKEKRDENGNVLLDKNGNPKHELNWAYARKEGLREVITGPSAFIIPMVLLKYIKKYSGAANNVKMDYIDGFSKHFADFTSKNLNTIETGIPNREKFYTSVYEDIIEQSINSKLPENEKLSTDVVLEKAKAFAQKQVGFEDAKLLPKDQRAARLKDLGTSVVDDFMALKKSTLSGKVNELAVEFSSTIPGKKSSGSISEVVKALPDYYKDALGFIKKSLKENATVTYDKGVEELVAAFRSKRLGTRLLTNLGLFGIVAAFYTQIPKLYNMGLKGNPALANQSAQNDSADTKDKKNVSFTGLSSAISKLGDRVFSSSKLKKVSDIYELSGPIIEGSAMATLLYGFCIPPRLSNAQDKYDFSEILVRDLSAFSALLFGAKALARLSSDALTKHTGLALNIRNMEGRNIFQRTLDYLKPGASNHTILSNMELESKYTNIDAYKNGIVGFMDFLEASGGNLKKAFLHDASIKETVGKIVQEKAGVSLADASSKQIREALTAAKDSPLMKDLYTVFKSDNGILRKAKVSNSLFGFLSTFVLVPGFIIALTDICTKMTEKRINKNANNMKNDAEKIINSTNNSNKKVMNPPTMEGFLRSAK